MPGSTHILGSLLLLDFFLLLVIFELPCSKRTRVVQRERVKIWLQYKQVRKGLPYRTQLSLSSWFLASAAVPPPRPRTTIHRAEQVLNSQQTWKGVIRSKIQFTSPAIAMHVVFLRIKCILLDSGVLSSTTRDCEKIRHGTVLRLCTFSYPVYLSLCPCKSFWNSFFQTCNHSRQPTGNTQYFWFEVVTKT